MERKPKLMDWLGAKLQMDLLVKKPIWIYSD
jgi:hypothetical protein